MCYKVTLDIIKGKEIRNLFALHFQVLLHRYGLVIHRNLHYSTGSLDFIQTVSVAFRINEVAEVARLEEDVETILLNRPFKESSTESLNSNSVIASSVRVMTESGVFALGIQR